MLLTIYPGAIRATVVIWLAALAGCASTLPQYPWSDSETALRIMAQRADQVRNLSAQGQITLTRVDGMSVVLDCAMVVEPPSHLRLRAWKLDRAVLDLTAGPDGLWAWTAQNPEAPDRGLPADAVADAILTYVAPQGDFFRDSRWRYGDLGPRLFGLERPAGDQGPALRLEVDRRTLVVRKTIILNDEGGEACSIVSSDFRDGGPSPWAARIVAKSDRGRIDLRTREVEFNADLPPDVFVAPHRAVRVR